MNQEPTLTDILTEIQDIRDFVGPTHDLVLELRDAVNKLVAKVNHLEQIVAAPKLRKRGKQ